MLIGVAVLARLDRTLELSQRKKLSPLKGEASIDENTRQRRISTDESLSREACASVGKDEEEFDNHPYPRGSPADDLQS